jgi:hypothetical protein
MLSLSTVTFFSSGCVSLGTGEPILVVARRQIADLLRERADLLVVDVELHARLRAVRP